MYERGNQVYVERDSGYADTGILEKALVEDVEIMAKTKIEWTERNWNPFYGCRRVSPGCENCYAESMASRFIGIDKKGRTLPYTGIAKKVGGQGRWTGEVKLNEDVLTEPLRIKKPTKFFVNSMSDTFYEKMPDEWLDKLFAVMALCPQHTFQILTKRPERMKERVEMLRNYSDVIGQFWVGDAIEALLDRDIPAIYKTRIDAPLPNVWLGVSVENQKAADERIPFLLQTPAAVRWLSVEPLLEAVDLGRRRSGSGWDEWLTGRMHRGPSVWDGEPKVDWVVLGGESGGGARECNVRWIRQIVEQCKAAEVPVFVKQLGKYPVQNCGQCGRMMGHCLGGAVDACGPTHALVAHELMQIRNSKGGDINEFPEDLRIREFPEAV